jgi:hypothetical protein
VPVAVVELARLALREHLVGLDHLAEAGIRVGRVGDIRMELAGKPPERLLDLPLVGSARDSEHLVVVALGRRHRPKGTAAARCHTCGAAPPRGRPQAAS